MTRNSEGKFSKSVRDKSRSTHGEEKGDLSKDVAHLKKQVFCPARGFSKVGRLSIFFCEIMGKSF